MKQLNTSVTRARCRGKETAGCCDSDPVNIWGGGPLLCVGYRYTAGNQTKPPGLTSVPCSEGKQMISKMLNKMCCLLDGDKC